VKADERRVAAEQAELARLAMQREQLQRAEQQRVAAARAREQKELVDEQARLQQAMQDSVQMVRCSPPHSKQYPPLAS
jgi:hypothetical protein